MAKYVVSSATAGTPQAMSSAFKTVVSLTSLTGATTLRRAWINHFGVGTDGTPGDTAMTVQVDRQTTVGTGTAATPAPLDGGDAAALIVGTANNTVEPTVTAATALVSQGWNQRAGFLWYAPPGGELIVPAVTVNGIGVRTKCTTGGYTGTSTAYLHFWE